MAAATTDERETNQPISHSLGRRVGSGVLWSGLSSLFLRFSSIAITAVVVRIVTPEQFGVFAAALTVHAVVSSIGDLGLTSCLTRRDLDFDRLAPSVAAASIVSATALAVAMSSCATQLASFLGAPAAATPIRVLSLAVVLNGIFTVPVAKLARDFRQRAIFWSTVTSFAPANILLVILAATGQGALAFAWSRVVGHLVAGLFALFAARWRRRIHVDRDALRFVLRIGLPLAGANVLNYALLNADYAFIARLLGPVELGVYVLAFNVASWSTSVLGAVINGVTLSAISEMNSDRERLRRAIRSSVQIVAIVAFPIAALSVALSRPLVLGLYGDKWQSGAPVLCILAVYGALFSASLLFANVLVGVGHSKLLLYVQGLWITTLIPAMYFGVHVHRVIGVAIAHVVVIAFVIIPVYVVVLRNSTGIPTRHVAGWARRPAISAGVAGACAYIIQLLTPGPVLLRLFIAGLLGVSTYLLLVKPMLRTLLPDEAKLTLRTVASRFSMRSPTRPTVCVPLPRQKKSI